MQAWDEVTLLTFEAIQSQTMRVIVQPYSSQWAFDFLKIKSELTEALKATSYVSIEHVGSTSVPGLAAKPIIDIDIVVKRQDVKGAIDACRAAGYDYMGEWGIPDRHALRAPLALPVRNLYVCVEGCLALKNHIAVRDLLMADAQLRDEYAAVKFELADRDVADVDEYCEGKNNILRKILKKAGIRREEVEAVEQMNTGNYTEALRHLKRDRSIEKD